MIDTSRPLPEKARRIVEWREHLATMDDEKFFTLIRMYLGEVKTPFNKQNLIENLSAFLRREENKRAIVTMLGKRDVQIVSAVSMLGEPELPVLKSFLSGKIPSNELSVNLENLEERLVLYRHKSKTREKEIISLVPLMEEFLSPVVSSDSVLQNTASVKVSYENSFTISDLFVASYISFLLEHKDAVKLDGSFKKHGAEELEETFGENTKVLSTLHTALINLSLFKIENKHVVPDWQNLDNFASLSRLSQYLYLCVAASGKYFSFMLRDLSERLQNILNAIPEEGYPLGTIKLCDTLLSEKKGAAPKRSSRFSEILSRSEDSDFYARPSENAMEKTIAACIELGLLKKCGSTDSGESVFAPSEFFASLYEEEDERKSLSIDSAFSVTILPGLSLKKLLSLVKFMNIRKADTAATFDITRKSVMRGFDAKLSPEGILSLLSSSSDFPLPQGLCVSLEEWYGSYASISLFNGYVLQVKEQNISLVLNNPKLSNHIVHEIAPGCYLMDFANDSHAASIMEESGLDFTGKVRTALPEASGNSLAQILPDRQNVLSSVMKKKKESATGETSFKMDFDAQKKLLCSLKNELEKISCTEDQRKALNERIERRIVVTPEQLRPTSVRFENIEAGAMDFQGKLHIVENAITNGYLLEILTGESTTPLVGIPVSLDKKNDMTMVVSWKEGPFDRVKEIPLRTCVRIRKVRPELHFD